MNRSRLELGELATPPIPAHPIDLFLARAAQALPAEVVEVLAANIPAHARGMAEGVARELPHLAADSDLETLFTELLTIALAVLRDRRSLTAEEADRINAVWSREVAAHDWSLDDVIELNKVVAFAGWESSLPLLAEVPGLDRTALSELAPSLMRAVDASGPYIASTFAAAGERFAAERRERRRRFARTALLGSRSDGDLRRQARELDLPLAGSYLIGAIRAGEDLPGRLNSVAMSQWEARLGEGSLVAEVDEALVVAIPAGQDAGADADRMRRALAGGISALGGRAVGGISSPVETLADLPRGLREAAATADLVERTDPSGTVAGFAERLVDHLLLGDTTLVSRLVDEVLGPVLAERSAAALLETLEAYYAHDGNASRVATALDVHRHTVDYRISRLRDLLGRDRPLTRPDLVLAVAGHRLLRAPSR